MNQNHNQDTSLNNVITVKLLMLLALLSLLGIFFFPRLELIAGAKLRLEDLTYIIISLILLYRFLTGKILVYNEFILPLVYFAYPFCISLARAISGQEWGPYFLVFWGKEFQYFIFFVLFFYLTLKENIEPLLYFLLILVLFNALYGTYSIVFRIKDYYGIGTPFLRIASALSGQIYFGGAIVALFINYFDFIKSKTKRLFIYLLMVVSIICCLATGAKSSSFAVMAFFTLFYVLNDFMMVNKIDRIFQKLLKWYILMILMALLIFVVAIKWDYQIGDYINLGRLANPAVSVMRRYKEDIIPKFTIFDSPLDIFVGVGYLAGQEPGGEIHFTSGYDSQYGRNLMVLGIIGTVIWICMLGKFGWYLRANRKLFIYYCSLLIAYLVMGFGLESFQSSKSGPIFWIITGMLLGRARRKRIMLLQNKETSCV